MSAITSPSDPMFSRSDGTYVGRLIVELWTDPSTEQLPSDQRDAAGIAVLIQPSGNETTESQELLRRILSGLSIRFG